LTTIDSVQVKNTVHYRLLLKYYSSNKENEMNGKIAITILIIINIVVVFWYTAKSSIKHNNRIIERLKENNDKSGNWMI